MLKHKLYATPFSKVYPYYVVKAVKKGRTQEEVNKIILWLTGYTKKQFEKHLEKGTTFEDFYLKAKKPNPKRSLIKGKVCGVQVDEIEDRVMREMRYLDKLIDELAKGKKMEDILRK